MSSTKSSLSKSLSKTASVVDDVLSSPNDIVLWVVRVTLVLLASVIVPMLPAQTLVFVDNTVVRVLVAVSIVLLALYDPASSVVMAVAFLVALHSLKCHRMSKLATAVTMDSPVVTREEDSDDENELSEPYTNNSQIPDANQVFTSSQQFIDAQSNLVSEDQNTEVRTWNNELGPQGLSTGVTGFSYQRNLLSSACPL